MRVPFCVLAWIRLKRFLRQTHSVIMRTEEIKKFMERHLISQGDIRETHRNPSDGTSYSFGDGMEDQEQSAGNAGA